MSAQDVIDEKRIKDDVLNKISGETPGAPSGFNYEIISEDDDSEIVDSKTVSTPDTATNPDQSSATNQEDEQNEVEDAGSTDSEESQDEEVEIGLTTDTPSSGSVKRKSKLKIKNEIIDRLTKNRDADKDKIGELEERLKFQQTVNHLDSTDQVGEKEPVLVAPDPIDYDGFEEGTEYQAALKKHDEAVKLKQNKELDARVEARMDKVSKKKDAEETFARQEEQHFERAQKFIETHKVKDYAGSEAHFIQKYGREARNFLISTCSNSHLIIKRAHKNPHEIEQIMALAGKKTEESANKALMLLGELNAGVVVKQPNYEQTDALDGDIGGGIIKSASQSAEEVDSAPGARFF